MRWIHWVWETFHLLGQYIYVMHELCPPLLCHQAPTVSYQSQWQAIAKMEVVSFTTWTFFGFCHVFFFWIWKNNKQYILSYNWQNDFSPRLTVGRAGGKHFHTGLRSTKDWILSPLSITNCQDPSAAFLSTQTEASRGGLGIHCWCLFDPRVCFLHVKVTPSSA